MVTTETKETLLKLCTEKVESRFQKINQVLEDIAESLKDESRSTAGDKHQTGRAMLDIEREKASKQLKEIEILWSLLNKIDIKTESDYVRLGSLVETEKATYFISISVGSIEIDAKSYLCIALNTPVGKVLQGKKKGDAFTFNNHNNIILAVN